MSMQHPPEGIDSGAIKFDFRGRAGEWFGIWIVNLLLSIVTVGIYSAWAKVRRKKYFYNNTFVGDRNFDYHATGKQILIGRIIVVAAYIVLNILVAVVPILGLVAIVALLVALPFLLVRSIKFNARVSSFSNVGFDFKGGAGKAFMVYILYPILIYIAFIALGFVGILVAQTGSASATVIAAILGTVGAIVLSVLAIPIIDRAIKNFTIDNHKLGTSEFDFNVSLKPFVTAMCLAIAWVLVVFVLVAIIGGVSASSITYAVQNAENDPNAMLAFMGLLYAVMFIGFIPAAFIYQAFTRNAIYNNVTLGQGHRFASNISPFKLFWIAISNMVVVIFTLGLMLPWAQIRISKYLADHTYAIPQGGLDSFIGGEIDAGGAIGDAFTDLESIDVGLPI